MDGSTSFRAETENTERRESADGNESKARSSCRTLIDGREDLRTVSQSEYSLAHTRLPSLAIFFLLVREHKIHIGNSAGYLYDQLWPILIKSSQAVAGETRGEGRPCPCQYPSCMPRYSLFCLARDDGPVTLTYTVCVRHDCMIIKHDNKQHHGQWSNCAPLRASLLCEGVEV